MLSERSISVRVELARTTPAAPTRGIVGFGCNVSDLTLIPMIRAVETGCPVEEVQLGTLRPRFANRVDALEAIEATCEQATGTGEQQPTFGDNQ